MTDVTTASMQPWLALYPDLDVEALDEVMTQIETHPETWHQGYWATRGEDLPAGNECGTAFCFAGWRARLDGRRPLFHSGNTQTYLLWPEGLDPDVDSADDVDFSHAVDIEAYARGRLGLNPAPAWELFHASNSLSDLRRIVAALKAGVDITDREFTRTLDRDWART